MAGVGAVVLGVGDGAEDSAADHVGLDAENLRGMVTMVHVGNKGSLEQILFTEDSLRCPVSVRALDHDPREGIVFVARWDFELVA